MAPRPLETRVLSVNRQDDWTTCHSAFLLPLLSFFLLFLTDHDDDDDDNIDDVTITTERLGG